MAARAISIKEIKARLESIKGLKLKEAAAKLNVSVGTISSWKNKAKNGIGTKKGKVAKIAKGAKATKANPNLKALVREAKGLVKQLEKAIKKAA